MAEDDSTREFPDVSQKLAAPKKISAFERERQEAKAKEKRAEAENAAALKAFEDSFADGDDGPARNSSGDDDQAGFLRESDRGYGGPRGRFGGPPRRSGPGSLGPLPGPPPPSLRRKRALEEMREEEEARRESEMNDAEYSRSDQRGTPNATVQMDERVDDAPRPTLQMSCLPPGYSPDDVKTLLRDHVKVQTVRLLPPAGPEANNKRSISAIATLSPDASSTQIDAAVTALKDQYLSCGFRLSIARGLSSSAIHPSLTVAPNLSDTSSEPFAAEKPRNEYYRPSMRNAPPPMDQRGFAPPESYDTPARSRYDTQGQPDSSVSVRPPLDIESIKAVHTIVDLLLLEPDPERALETEAMLMALPEVQKDERFAFLYDSRTPAGIYYRFLLWCPEDREEVVKEMKNRAVGPERIHEDIAIDWSAPYLYVPFADLTSLADVVTDVEYDSSDEEDDDEGERRMEPGQEVESVIGNGEKKQLTPLRRARLVHLLARLPTSNARLRKGDVARVTNFAINHAGEGAEEIVDTLLLNVKKPFSYSLAAKYEDAEAEQEDEDVYSPDEDLPTMDSPAPQPPRDSTKRDDDPATAKLISLYVISDILSASSTAGARNAWKYRQLFEAGFKAQKTFEHLGRLEKDLAWGRMKAEQWKRKVDVVFGIWEGWSVFSSDVQAELKRGFFEPPMTEKERLVEAVREAKARREEEEGKFKEVVQTGASADETTSPAPLAQELSNAKTEDSVDGQPMDAMDGEVTDDQDGEALDALDGEALDGMDDAAMDDIDGKPIEDNDEKRKSEIDGTLMGGLDGTTDEKPATQDTGVPSPSAASSPIAGRKPAAPPRRRMRAEDMFADSDGE